MPSVFEPETKSCGVGAPAVLQESLYMALFSEISEDGVSGQRKNPDYQCSNDSLLAHCAAILSAKE